MMADFDLGLTECSTLLYSLGRLSHAITFLLWYTVSVLNFTVVSTSHQVGLRSLISLIPVIFWLLHTGLWSRPCVA